MGLGTCSDPSGPASTQGGGSGSSNRVCAVADVAWGLGAGPGWSFKAPAAWMLLLGRPPAGAQGVAGLCWCRQAGPAMGDGAPCRVWSWVPPGGLLFVTVGCCEATRGPVDASAVPGWVETAVTHPGL